MALEYLSDDMRVQFPHPSQADRWGIVAHGGNLSPGVLLSAYEQGIFPWYDEPPILWFSPEPRFVLRFDEFHVPKRLARTIRTTDRTVTFDRAFGEVIERCSSVPRAGQAGTWINSDMIAAYNEMHRLGYAHSVEVWGGGALIGGLYGVAVGSVFAGESMFSIERDASKFALVALVGLLGGWGVDLIDSQVETRHITAFGARSVSREVYLQELERRRARQATPSDWSPENGALALAAGVELSKRTSSRR